MAGASEVVLSDQVRYMLESNARRNFEKHPEITERIRVEELEWGNDAHYETVRPPFDVLLGSDLMYVSEDLNLLADTLAELSKPGTVVYFSTPRRDVDRDTEFYNRCRENGFAVEDISASEAIKSALPPPVAKLLRVPRYAEPKDSSRYVLRDEWASFTIDVSLFKMTMASSRL